MTGFDDVLIGLLAVGLIYGYVRGLIRQVVSIAGLLAAYFAAYRYFHMLSPWLKKNVPVGSWSVFKQFSFKMDGFDTYLYNTLAFVLIFIGVKLVLTLLGSILNMAAKIPGIGWLNRMGGALLAGAETVLLIVLAVQIMQLLPSVQAQHWLDHSALVPWIDKLLPQVTDHLHKVTV